MTVVKRSTKDDLLDGEINEKARTSVEQPQRKDSEHPAPDPSEEPMQAVFDFDDQGSPNTISTRG